MRTERRRHADQDGVALREAVVVVGGLRRPAAERRRHALRPDMADVRLPTPQRLGLPLVHVEADDAKTALAEQQYERQPDIPEPDHATVACGWCRVKRLTLLLVIVWTSNDDDERER